MHHDTPRLQLPFTHDVEQQSVSSEQALPDVLHAVLSGVQVWSDPHVPLQHSPSFAQL
jgi:hypothetical protein